MLLEELRVSNLLARWHNTVVLQTVLFGFVIFFKKVNRMRPTPKKLLSVMLNILQYTEN
jgi:hypothetical protein